MNILLVGPLPPPLGGATVLFQQLVEDVTRESDINVHVLRTNSENSNAGGRIGRMMSLIKALLEEARYVDVVSLNASTNSALILAFVVGTICRFRRKRWFFRGFGGLYGEWYQRSSFAKKMAIRLCFGNASLLLLETKQSVSFFQNLNLKTRTLWFPNSRPSNLSVEKCVDSDLGRFIYLGQVCIAKGIREILAAANRLPENVSIDVYGPLLDGLSPEDINFKNVKYKGIVSPDKVASLLVKYTALVFPTRYEGEGYPGVILEAYSVGVPVITTKFRAIPEIVDDSSGILIEPGDIDELSNAMIELATNIEHLEKLRVGAIRRSEEFSSAHWGKEFVRLCRVLV